MECRARLGGNSCMPFEAPPAQCINLLVKLSSGLEGRLLFCNETMEEKTYISRPDPIDDRIFDAWGLSSLLLQVSL
jgi:hypothetical protein